MEQYGKTDKEDGLFEKTEEIIYDRDGMVGLQNESREKSENEDCLFEKRIKDLETIYYRDGMVGLQKELREQSEHWKKVPARMAVIGEVNAGKSSFINAVLGLTAEDGGSAKVGVTHKTTEPKDYAHPRCQNFILTDMPGIGTPYFKKGEYLKDKAFEKCDYYLVLSATSFTENVRWLVEQIQRHKANFYFIRTHVDSDIRDNKRSHPTKHNAASVISEIRYNCIKYLRKLDVTNPKIYLIDNYDITNNSLDFGKLEEQLLVDTSLLKLETLAFSLSSMTLKILQRKQQYFLVRIPFKAFFFFFVFFYLKR